MDLALSRPGSGGLTGRNSARQPAGGTGEAVSSGRLARFLDACRRDLGTDHVVTDPAALEQANRSTFPGGGALEAVVRPGHADEVLACLGHAARTGRRLQPASRGCNWGYGSRRPAGGDAVLLDLSRLDRILALDEDLGLVTLEPGVTFGLLAERLSCTRFLAPRTGAAPAGSIIGNALERGIGLGLYEDMAGRLVALTVALPNGRILNLGGAAPGCGPDLMPLFVQSDLGVVLSAVFALEPAPAHRQIAILPLADSPALGRMLDAVRPLLQTRDPRLNVKVLSQVHVDRLPAEHSPPAAKTWTAVFTLWADDDPELEARRKRLIGALPSTLGEVELWRAEPGADAVEGARLHLAYPPGPVPADADPDRDGRGVLWIAPCLPMQGDKVAAALSAIAAEMGRFSLPPAMSLRIGDGRSVKLIVGLFFDAEDAGAVARALACRRALARTLAAADIPLYRASLLDGDRRAGDPGALETLAALKAWTDPQGVLAPSRHIG